MGERCAISDELSQWLNQMVGNYEIPMSELNETTLSLLQQIMVTNKEADKAAVLIKDDLKKKIEEYEAETSRMNTTLQNCGISPEELPPHIQSQVENFVDMAVSLQLKDCSATSFQMGVMDFERKKCEGEKDHLELQKSVQELKKKLKLRESQVQLFKEKASEVSKENAASSKLSHHSYFDSKQKNYTEAIARFKDSLKKIYSDSISHDALVELSKKIQVSEKELLETEEKLKYYAGLPPDEPVIRAKVEEARKELSSLNDQIREAMAKLTQNT